MMKSANPEMMILARESRGLTQKDLAAAVGVNQMTISRLEKGDVSMSPEIVKRLSEALRYPEEFFYESEPRLGIGPTELFHYRKKQSVGKRRLDTIHAQLNIRRMQVRRLLAAVEMEAVRKFPHLDIAGFDGDAAEVARAVRAMWRIPRGPIRNVTTLIEDAGGIVTHFDFAADGIDAISRQIPEMPPMFFMNANVGGGRYRYTLAHELGHMVMHSVPNGEMEEQANAFAAEFLMPADDIRPMLSGSLTLPKLAGMTAYWRVSIAALLQRACDLKRVALRIQRSLWAQLASAGYKTQEPPELDFAVEEPSLLRTILETHTGGLGFSNRDLAKIVALFEDEMLDVFRLRPRGL